MQANNGGSAGRFRMSLMEERRKISAFLYCMDGYSSDLAQMYTASSFNSSFSSCDIIPHAPRAPTVAYRHQTGELLLAGPSYRKEKEEEEKDEEGVVEGEGVAYVLLRYYTNPSSSIIAGL